MVEWILKRDRETAFRKIESQLNVKHSLSLHLSALARSAFLERAPNDEKYPRAHNYCESRRKANVNCIHFYFLPPPGFLSSRNERLSPFFSFAIFSLRTTFTLSLLYFLFLHFPRKVTSDKVGASSKFRWKLAVATAFSELWALSARTYGKSLQLALITLEWSTINSRNLPLNLGHGYRVLRNRATA